ncbi:olfactory receptor 7G2-like [Suncus etruscus]|uniref:olfactory receptor 7G2-like n=1 Tax=Suncus etruscus TaxID=109475 RepID=UPI002110AEB4|nr:olfactory receptor 7G2-like [Suncus etruscus]
MEARNVSEISGFLLLEVTQDPELQPLVFLLFLSIYLVTVLGNLLIILAVLTDPHLHHPMYIFLCNLSFVDICISTTTLPKMLLNLRDDSQAISYPGCLTQLFFVLLFTGLESFLLSGMAYDRYVAICHPLCYAAIMNSGFCLLVILSSLLLSLADALLHSLMLLSLTFCATPQIPLFFCEVVQVIKVACSDTLLNNILIYSAMCVFGGLPLGGIIFSYTQIVSSVLRISSAGGKSKAFLTCVSHLSVVTLFYGTGLGVYISSAITSSPRNTAVASTVYMMVPQMLNPFIYSLRNKDMVGTLRQLSRKILLVSQDVA